MSENKAQVTEKEATKIEIDFGNHDAVVAAMDKYHHLDTMIFGENSEGESQFISIYQDKIYVDTCQSNGWVRKNIYHRDGTVEEMYESDEIDDGNFEDSTPVMNALSQLSLEDLSRSLAHLVFRNSVVEDLHTKNAPLDDNAMKIINKDVHNRIFTLLNWYMSDKIEDRDRLADLVVACTTFGKHNWDNPNMLDITQF